MATFFGEVREVSSRAVWWSDTEDDVEDDKPESPSPKSSPIFTVHGTADGLSQCSKLFLSMVKKLSPTDDRLMSIKNSDSKGDVAALYKRQNGRFLLKFSNEFADKNRPFLLGKAVYDNILSKINWSNAIMILVSKDFSNLYGLQYFIHDQAGNHPILSEISQSLAKDNMPLVQLLPPLTLSNHMELHLIEMAILRKLPFLVLILPSENPEAGSDWIPQEILNNVNAFHDLSFSNLIT